MEFVLTLDLQLVGDKVVGVEGCYGTLAAGMEGDLLFASGMDASLHSTERFFVLDQSVTFS